GRLFRQRGHARLFVSLSPAGNGGERIAAGRRQVGGILTQTADGAATAEAGPATIGAEVGATGGAGEGGGVAWAPRARGTADDGRRHRCAGFAGPPGSDRRQGLLAPGRQVGGIGAQAPDARSRAASAAGAVFAQVAPAGLEERNDLLAGRPPRHDEG